LADALNQDNVKAVPFDDPEMCWSVYMIKKRGVELTEAARIFRRYFLKEMEAGIHYIHSSRT